MRRRFLIVCALVAAAVAAIAGSAGASSSTESCRKGSGKTACAGARATKRGASRRCTGRRAKSRRCRAARKPCKAKRATRRKRRACRRPRKRVVKAPVAAPVARRPLPAPAPRPAPKPPAPKPTKPNPKPTPDTTPPQTTLAPSPLVAPAATFEFSSEPLATFECRLGEGTWAPCTSAKVFANLAEGDYRFEVRAVDRAGNRDPSPAARDFTIDHGTVSWSGDFETSDLSQWRWKQATAWGATVVSDPTRQGRRAARFEVRPGDDPINSRGERAELLTGVADGGGVEGQETWYGWSTRFPANLNPSTGQGSFNIFTQWHENVSGRCIPPLSFMVDTPAQGPRMRMRVRGGREVSPCVYETHRDFDFGPIQHDRWYDFVVHVKWSADPAKGFIEAWLNGQRVVPLTTGATMAPGSDVYLKQGWYRTDSPQTSVVFHDGMKRGSSYRAVDPSASH